MFGRQQNIGEEDGSVQFTRQHTAVSVASPKPNSRPQTAKISQRAKLTFKDVPGDGIKYQSYQLKASTHTFQQSPRGLSRQPMSPSSNHFESLRGSFKGSLAQTASQTTQSFKSHTVRQSLERTQMSLHSSIMIRRPMYQMIDEYEQARQEHLNKDYKQALKGSIA